MRICLAFNCPTAGRQIGCKGINNVTFPKPIGGHISCHFGLGLRLGVTTETSRRRLSFHDQNTKIFRPISAAASAIAPMICARPTRSRRNVFHRMRITYFGSLSGLIGLHLAIKPIAKPEGEFESTELLPAQRVVTATNKNRSRPNSSNKLNSDRIFICLFAVHQRHPSTKMTKS